MQETLEQLSLEIYPQQKCTVSDFRARLLALLDAEQVSMIQEGLSFLKLCGLLKSDTLIYSSPKMSKDFSTTTKDEPSEQSSERWMNWGMMRNGKYVTANTSEYPRTGKECSLSDILGGGACREPILPLQADDPTPVELQGCDVYANTVTLPTRSTVGVYPIDGGGVLKVNGYHKK